MKYLFAIATLLAASSASAVSVTSVAGAPDLGPTAGENLVMTFDGPDPAGWTWSGGYAVAPGGILNSGVAAPPAGAGNTYAPTNYAYVSPATSSPATLAFGNALRTVSLYWGSIDDYNTLEVLGAGNAVIATILGGTLPPAGGNQFSGNTNRRVFIDANGFGITGLRFSSSQAAFEFDDIAGQGVPEPQSWAMLIAGMGLVGVMSRRRRQVTISA